jgi:hypothetical protein
MSDTLKDIYGTEMPYTQYNTLGVIASAAPAAVVGVDAMIKANEAKRNLKIQQGYVDTLMTQYMNTPIYNPYKNVGVATKAAQMQVEETDKALANTLDTLRATGAAAGGATALAQAALKSKLGVSADIEKQEVANKQLEAKGEFMVQQAEMSRKGEQMDYEQSKADQLRTEQFAYQERASDMAGTLGGLGLEASRGLTIGKGNDKTTIPSPEGEVGDALTPTRVPPVSSNLTINPGNVTGSAETQITAIDPSTSGQSGAVVNIDPNASQSTNAIWNVNQTPQASSNIIPQAQVVPDLNYTGSWSDIKEIKKIRDSVAKDSPEYEDAQKKINQWYYKKDPVKYSYLKNKI